MDKQSLIRKLTSRKFIVTLIAAVAGIVTMFVGESEIVDTLAGMAMTVVPAVAYCIMEGKVDAESAKTIAHGVKDAAQSLGASSGVIDTIDHAAKLSEAILEAEEVFDLDAFEDQPEVPEIETVDAGEEGAG